MTVKLFHRFVFPTTTKFLSFINPINLLLSFFFFITKIFRFLTEYFTDKEDEKKTRCEKT